MKLFEAFYSALLLSLIAGALLFLGLPLAIDYIISDGKLSLTQSEGIWILLLMYGIYAMIQLALSILNVVQAHYLLIHNELEPEKPRTLHNFFIAECSLYLMVFVIMVALVPVPEIVGVVILFSIPYYLLHWICIYFPLFSEADGD